MTVTFNSAQISKRSNSPMNDSAQTLGNSKDHFTHNSDIEPGRLIFQSKCTSNPDFSSPNCDPVFY